MVALLGLFQHRQVLVEFLLVAPRRPIDALQHGVMFVTPPIGAGDRHQLKGIGRNLARVFYMGPTAQIFKRILPVGANWWFFGHLVAIFVDATLFQAVDQFQFVRLILEKLARLIRAYLAVDQRMFGGDNLAHPLLNRFQIFGREGARPAIFIFSQVEIVVKAGVNWRPNRNLGRRKEFQHGLCHYMGRRMPNFVELILLLMTFTHDRYSFLLLSHLGSSVKPTYNH